MKDELTLALTKRVVGRTTEIGKKRTYIEDPSQAPEDVEVQEGPRGGLFYETEGSDGDTEAESPVEFELAPTEENDKEYFYDFEADDANIQLGMGIPKDGEAADMFHLWIADEHRGQGVGQELMEAAEQEARERGMKHFNAVIGGDKDAAEGFFESMGYESGFYEDGEVKPEETTEWSQFTKPLVSGEEAEESGDSFYHGTNGDGARNLVENGINESLLQTRDSGFFGEGFYVTARESTAQNYADSSDGEGSDIVEVQLQPDAETLDVTHVFEDGSVRPTEPPEWHEEFLSYYEGVLEEAAVWEKIPGKEREDIINEETMGKMTPGHDNFQREKWYENVTNFATDAGYGAVHFVDSEIIVTDPDQIESIDYADGEKSKAPTFLDTQEVFVVVDPPEMNFSETWDEANVKEAILKEMNMGMFAALASETPAPYVSEVDEDYNDVDGNTPNGETAEGNINRKTFKARRYVNDPSEVPEEYEPQEGERGGVYYEVEGDSEVDDPDGGELTIEDVMQNIQEFDESEFEYGEWRGGGYLKDPEPGIMVDVMDNHTFEESRGQIVNVQGDDVFAVTEEGEVVNLTGRDVMVDSFFDPQEWRDPDHEPEGEDTEEEAEEEEEQLPNWASEDPLEGIEESEAPGGELQDGELYEVGDDLAEAERVESDGELPVYQIGRKAYSAPDGVLSVNPNSPNSIQGESPNYLEFSEGSEWENGWYQINDLRQEDGDSDTVGFDAVTPSGESVFMDSSVFEGREREVVEVHIPVENTRSGQNVSSLPDPSGDPDPESWSVDWDNVKGTMADRPRLRDGEKKKLMREWRAAADPDAVDSVRDTIRSVKDETYTTQGQKLDKIVNAVMERDGEVRTGDFDDSEDPTPEEVEAMKVLQNASQHLFESHYGEKSTISRGLAGFAHENIMPVVAKMFSEEGEVSGKSFTLQDNAASVWTTDDSVAKHFTLQGADAMEKTLVVNENITSEEVFNMPDALMHYEQREDTGGEDADWNEGEINVHGSARELNTSQVEVVGSVGSSRHIAPIGDVVDNPAQVIQDGNRGAVEKFVKTVGQYAPEDFTESYFNRMLEDEEFRNLDGASKVIEEIERQQEEKMDKDTEAESDGYVVDIRSEEDSGWLYRVESNVKKARRYIQDPSDAPEGVEVQEGPQGGLFYEDPDQSEIDDFGEEAEQEPQEDEGPDTTDAPDFYEADFNEYVQSFIEAEGIPLTVPDSPNMDDLREAKEDWERSKDALSEFMDAGAEVEEAMEVVTFAANRRDEIRRRRNSRGGGSGNTPNAPEPVEPVSEEELGEYDGEIPDGVPDDMEPMFAAAEASDSYRQFRETVNQNGMMDISNRKVHRFGRALSGDPDYELPDLGNMEDADLSGIADHDPDTARRIQDAREDGTITMYRAVPEFVEETGVGDYVALNPDYVQRHGENVLGAQQDEAWHILEDEVPLEDVGWPGEDAEEFVYSPKEIRDHWPSTKHFYEDISGDDTKSAIANAVAELTKERVYVDDPSEIPQGVTPQEGEQGGVYYDTDELGEEDGDDPQTSPPTPDELIDAHGMDSLDDVENTIAAGILEGTDLGDLAERIAEEKGGRYINRVLKDVEKSVSKPIEGYEHPAKAVYFWDDETEFPQEAENKFLESVDDDIGEAADRVFSGWWKDMFSDEVAPLWQAVVSETGNSNFLEGKDVHNNETSVNESKVTDVGVSESEMEAVHAYKDHVENITREMYGDTVTVYRGLHGDAGEKLREAKEKGESLEMERRPIESYSTELRLTKEYAKKPGGVVIKEEVPVEDVWASSDAGFLVDTENELAVAHDEMSEIDPDNILTPEDLDDGATNIELVGEKARELVQ